MMSPKLKQFLLRWLNSTAAVFVATCVIKGIHYDTIPGLIVATFLLGILNTFLRPLLMLLSLPLMVFTLGLFTLVINAFLLYLVGSVVNTFHVDSFAAAFWGALIISLISLVLNSLTGTTNTRIQMRRRTPPPPDHRDDGGGPIIDV
jgi:putative membrane protein